MMTQNEILKRLDARLWLCFFTILLFFVALPVSAFVDDDFDSYNDGDVLGNVSPDWENFDGQYGCQYISNTRSVSSPLSFGAGDAQGFSGCAYPTATSTIGGGFFKLYVDEAGGGAPASFGFVVRQETGDFSVLSTWGPGGSTIDDFNGVFNLYNKPTPATYNLLWSDVTSDAWHTIGYSVDTVNDKIKYSLDGSGWTAWYTAESAGSDEQTGIGFQMYHGVGGEGFFVDDFSEDTGQGETPSVEPAPVINFDSFNLGDVHGQGDFTYSSGSHLFQVRNDENKSVSPYYALKAPWGQTSAYHLDAYNAITKSTLSFKILLSSFLDDGDSFILQPTKTETTWPFQIKFQYSQADKWKITSNNGSDYDHYTFLTKNHWYTVFVDYDFTLNEYRIGLDDSLGVYRDFKFTTNHFDYYKLSVDDNAGSFYVDDMLAVNFSESGRSATDPDVIIDFASGFGDFSPSLNVPDSIFCWTDTDCYLKYKYNQNAIDGIVYFMDDVIGAKATSTAIASTTLEFSGSMQDSFQLPNKSIPQAVDYCLFLVGTSTEEYPFTERYYCGIEAIWEATSTSPYFIEYDIGSACDDVPASSGSAADDFRYGIECGLRKALYWLVTPKAQTYLDLREAFSDLTTKFPMSIYFQIENSFWDLKATTTPAVSISFLPPDNELGLTGDFLDSQMLSDTFPTAWPYVYGTMVTIVYALGFLYFILRIIKVSRKEKE